MARKREGECVSVSGSEDSQQANDSAGDERSWPRSHGVYNVTLSVPVVAHSSSQAKKRAMDMLAFLSAWHSHEQGPHQASLYLYGDATPLSVVHLHDDTYEDPCSIGASMVSDREFIFDWLNPDSDADYDPLALAEQTYFCFDEEEE